MPVLMIAQSAKRYIGFNKFLESVEVDVLFQKNCNSIAKAQSYHFGSETFLFLGPLLLTWINCNPSIDK